MLKSTNPTQTRSWQALADHFAGVKEIRMADLFEKDPDRFNKLSLKFNDILVDYSKNRITEETLRLLLGLAEEVGVKDAIDKDVFRGKINETENRAVLHICLAKPGQPPILGGRRGCDAGGQCGFGKDERFFRQGHPADGRVHRKKITDIVNIGIGGSDLGPVMVTEALRPYARQADGPFCLQRGRDPHRGNPEDSWIRKPPCS